MQFKIWAVSAIALAVSCTQVTAQTINNGATSGSQSGANSQAFGNYNNFEGSKRSASAAIAPGLFASGLSCSGSASAGGAGGGWGISLGLTKEDAQCNTRENAKTVLGLTGDRDATKEVLCDIGQVRSAFRRVGRPCQADYQQQVNSGYSAPPSRAQRVTFRTMAACREYARTNRRVNCVRQ